MISPGFRISPDNQQHGALEARAAEHFRALGYFVTAQTYHETMPDEVVRLLSSNTLPSALYIRSRSDRLAISAGRQFEFEVKTHVNQKYSDLTVEIWPLMMHRMKALMIDCLYVCCVNGREFGFWASRIPKIKRAIIPDVEKNKHIAPIIRKWKALEGVPISENRTNGSNDPLFIISEETIASLDDWRKCVA